MTEYRSLNASTNENSTTQRNATYGMVRKRLSDGFNKGRFPPMRFFATSLVVVVVVVTASIRFRGGCGKGLFDGAQQGNRGSLGIPFFFLLLLFFWR